MNLNTALRIILFATFAVAASAQTYVYDDVGRLEKVLYPQGKGVIYTYDTTDNLLKMESVDIPRAVENLSFNRLTLTQAELSWEHTGEVFLYLIQSKMMGSDEWVNGASVDDVNARSAIVTIVDGEDRAYRIVVYGTDLNVQSAPSAAVVPPSAAPLMVTTLKDEDDHALGKGQGDSLREVIEAAVPGDVIRFDPNFTGRTIVLKGRQITIDKQITIDATPLPGRLAIDANGQSRAFSVSTADGVILKGLTLFAGSADRGGAIINNNAVLTIDSCQILGNVAVQRGGGIYNEGGGSLEVKSSVLSENYAIEGGGGIYNASDSVLRVRFSRITRNASENDGGGIYNSGASCTVENTVLSGNGVGANGGGFYNAVANALFVNSTLASNSSSAENGGGVFNGGSGDLILRHCTISANTGIGIVNSSPASLTLDNTILANNFDLLNNPLDIIGDYSAVGVNVVRLHTGALLSGSPSITADPVLGPLSSKGVMTPLAGSPVIDGGVLTSNTPSTDQISNFRPNNSTAPDIGSIESRLSSNTDLDWFSTSAGPLDPGFQYETTEYSASVASDVTSAAIRPAEGVNGQTIEVGITGETLSVVGSENASSFLPLALGENSVDIKVTAENGTTNKTYSLTIVRGVPSSANTSLSSLDSSVTLFPDFDSRFRGYSAIVADDVASISVTATPEVSEATMQVRSNFGPFQQLLSGIDSNPLNLNTGDNAIDILVTATDGATTEMYTLSVTREPPAVSNAGLASLSISAGSLNPLFSRGVSVYGSLVPDDITETTVTATTAQGAATIEASFNGSAFAPLESGVASSVFALNAGTNTIDLVVTASDGATQNAYALVVTRLIDSLEWVSLAGNSHSGNASISDDCRFVAFSSSASNLVEGDTNGNEDIFLYDRLEAEIRRISVGAGGVEGNRNSTDPMVSPDGQFVVFQSEASNLVANDTNGSVDPSQGRDIFVYDRDLDTLERVSLTDSGSESNQASENPSISGDGRFVAFESSANNLVTGYANGESNVYVYDREDNTIVGISIPFADFVTNRVSMNPAVSADGNFVAFEFAVDKNVDNQNLNYQYTDIYLYDRVNRGVERITGSKVGLDADDSESRAPSISADGRYVAYHSNLKDIDFYDTNNAMDVFVYDTMNGRVRRVSAKANEGGEINKESTNPAISGNGQFVVFESQATNLVDSDTNGLTDIFKADLVTGRIDRVSVSETGEQSDANVHLPFVSFDGRCIGFQTLATNLNNGDGNSSTDVYLSATFALAPSSVAELASLSTNLGAQRSGTNLYTASVFNDVDTAILDPILADEGATIRATVNGGLPEILPNGETALIALERGDNTIEIEVTAADGVTTKSYSLVVARAADVPSPDSVAELMDLAVNVGDISPSFDSATVDYTLAVPNEIASLKVSPLVRVSGSTLTVDDTEVVSGSMSASIGLAEGPNTIFVTVTAVDGNTTKTYQITVLRAPSDAILIRSVAFSDDATVAVPITWDSPLDGEYVIEMSEDLVEWETILDRVFRSGESTTVNVVVPETESGRVFLRVRNR